MANYLSILHAKSAAKQTQSQLFHPCFFTKISWSGFAYLGWVLSVATKSLSTKCKHLTIASYHFLVIALVISGVLHSNFLDQCKRYEDNFFNPIMIQTPKNNLISFTHIGVHFLIIGHVDEYMLVYLHNRTNMLGDQKF